MLEVIAAAALGAANVNIVDDPDFRCYAAITVSLGVGQETGKLSGEEKTALTMAVWYYTGRIDARFAGVSLADPFLRLVSAPDFALRLAADGKRCGKEVERKGQELQELGAEIQRRAPLIDRRSS